jgi:hypothetical protein
MNMDGTFTVREPDKAYSDVFGGENDAKAGNWPQRKGEILNFYFFARSSSRSQACAAAVSKVSNCIRASN